MLPHIITLKYHPIANSTNRMNSNANLTSLPLVQLETHTTRLSRLELSDRFGKPSFVYIPADSRAANQDGKLPKETPKARFERRAAKTLSAQSDIFNQCFSRKHRRPLDLPSRMKSRTNTTLISRLDFRCSLGPTRPPISSNRAYDFGALRLTLSREV